MENQSKEQIKQAINEIKEAQLKGWNEVRNIAEDILAYVNKDTRHFKIAIGSAVGLRIIYAYVMGTQSYAVYGEEVGEMTIKQVFEQFYKDERALVNMVKALAEAVKEVAEQNIKELEEQIQ